MKNKIGEILKERLENRLEWREYYQHILAHKEISKKVKKEFYKDKPLINFVLKLYFLPLNFFKYLSHLKAWHYYQMMDKEIEVLKKEMNDEGN